MMLDEGKMLTTDTKVSYWWWVVDTCIRVGVAPCGDENYFMIDKQKKKGSLSTTSDN